MQHRARSGGRSAPMVAVLALLGLLLGSVGSAAAQDRYEGLLAELPQVEIGSECTAEEEGDLAAVPGTIVICAPTADDPDRYTWREASGDEVRPAFERTVDDVEATQEGNDDADVDEDVLPETGAWTLLVAGMGLLALLLGGITLRRFRLPGARDLA